MLSPVNLPNSWSAMPGPNSGPNAWAQAYAQMGQASTAANQQLGQAFLAGSNQNLAQQQAALNRAFGFLRGTNRANIRSIDRRFAAESGSIMQDLINRGLGNSTIQGSMRTGLTRAHADAISGARAAFGRQMYDAAFQNAMANSGLAQQQLNTQFQGTNIGYPDLGAFAQMASMSGGGMSAAFGGGGYGGGGSLIQFDPSRPVGGALPAWAFGGGGGMIDPGVGGSGMSLADLGAGGIPVPSGMGNFASGIPADWYNPLT